LAFIPFAGHRIFTFRFWSGGLITHWSVLAVLTPDFTAIISEHFGRRCVCGGITATAYLIPAGLSGFGFWFLGAVSGSLLFNGGAEFELAWSDFFTNLCIYWWPWRAGCHFLGFCDMLSGDSLIRLLRDFGAR